MQSDSRADNVKLLPIKCEPYKSGQGGGEDFMLYSQSFHVREKCFNLMIILVKNESHH